MDCFYRCVFRRLVHRRVNGGLASLTQPQHSQWFLTLPISCNPPQSAPKPNANHCLPQPLLGIMAGVQSVAIRCSIDGMTTTAGSRIYSRARWYQAPGTGAKGTEALLERIWAGEYLGWIVSEVLRVHAPINSTMRVWMGVSGKRVPLVSALRPKTCSLLPEAHKG